MCDNLDKEIYTTLMRDGEVDGNALEWILVKMYHHIQELEERLNKYEHKG